MQGARERAQQLRSRFGERFGYVLEADILLLLAATAATLFVFATVADQVFAGRTHAFDEQVMLLLRSPEDRSQPLGPRWLQEMMRDYTGLGSTGVLLVLVGIVAGFLALIGKRGSAVLVVALTATGVALANLAKLGFERPRPDLVPHAVAVHSLSFPSQHALMSAVVYLTLGALIARTQERRNIKIYVMSVAMLLTALVGISRVYLGVHWPTDVLAGWALGAAWASLCWLIAIWLQRRGTIDEPTDVRAATSSRVEADRAS